MYLMTHSCVPQPFCSPPPYNPSYANVTTTHYKYTYSSVLSCTFTHSWSLLDPHFCPRMTPVLCLFLISRKPSCFASIVFLLVLAGHSATRVLGADRLRADVEDRVKGKLKSRVKEKLRPEAGFGDTTHRDGDEWGDPDTRTGVRSMFSRGEDRFWETRSSSRCFPIPPNMALCRNIGYDSMRMPNLLGHESPAEAAQQSASWLPLLARECHPDARIFLCSLFAPICLERYVYPKTAFLHLIPLTWVDNCD